MVLVEVGDRGSGGDGRKVVPVEFHMLLVGLLDGGMGEGVMGLGDVGIVHDGDVANVALGGPGVIEGEGLVEAWAEEMLEGLSNILVENPPELDAGSGALTSARMEAGADEAGDNGPQAGGLDTGGAEGLEDLALDLEVGVDGGDEDEGHDGVVWVDVLGGGAVALDGGVELGASREEEWQNLHDHELHGDGGDGHPEEREHAWHESRLGEEPGAGLEVVGGGRERLLDLDVVRAEVGDIGEVFDDGAVVMAAELTIGVDAVALGVDCSHDSIPIGGDSKVEGLASGLDELGLEGGGRGPVDLNVAVLGAVPWVVEEITQDHDLIGRHVVLCVVEVIEAGVAIELLASNGEPSVSRFVVELDGPSAVDSLRGDSIVLRDPDAASENITRRGSDLHGEGARVDDGEPSEGIEVRTCTQALEAIHTLGDIVGLLRGHGHLKGELLVAEHEGGRRRAPGGEDRLGLLDEDVKSIGILLQEAIEIDELAAHLGVGLVGAAVLFGPRLGVGRGRDEGDVDVEIVGVLDGADELLELVLEVLAALGAHHEVVLHGDGETMAHEVGLVGALGLGEGAGGGLVGDAGGEALVEGPGGPGELLVGVFNVLVGKDEGGEGGIGGIGDEAVDAVSEVGVGALQGLRQLQP